VDGRPEGGWTDAFEIICCDCGDDPGRTYCEVAPGLLRVRGPYTIRTGLAAYEAHLRQHHPARDGLPTATITDVG
jgi:hypothetical protein